MRIEQSQSIKQNQKVVLTQAMQQAFMVLQMPILELGQFVEEQIELNPLLEKREVYRVPPVLEWLEEVPSLYEHLMLQVQSGDFSEREKKIAERIIGNLDHRGFFDGKTKLSVLKKVQELDPPGIASKNLRECLLFQLRLRGKQNSNSYQLIRDRFDDLHRLKISKDVKRDIQSLDFAPGSRFHCDHLRTIIPDVMISESLKIQVNDETIPEFGFTEYKDLDPIYVREQMSACKWLYRIIQRRENLLLQITKRLVEKDSEYFRGEKTIYSGYPSKKMAELLNVSISTITRATSDKYLLTENGLVRMRSFFEKKEAKEALKKLITTEKIPHSDEALVKKLQIQGIRISRRTVAKYRRELNFLGVYQRAREQKDTTFSLPD